MTQSPRFPSSILVEVELPNVVPFPPELLDLLSSLRIVLVGWYAVPEQTSPEQARDQFEDAAEAALSAVAQNFEERGATVQTRLVFTGDELDTITRISAEENCDAVLIPGEVEHLHRLLLPIRGLQNADRIASLVADLVQDGTTDVTVVHVREQDETDEAVQSTVLEPMADLLRDEGIDAGIIQFETLTVDNPADALIDLAANYDTVVIGESEPSVRDVLFSTLSGTIAKDVEAPVIVVRHHQDPAPAGRWIQ